VSILYLHPYFLYESIYSLYTGLALLLRCSVVAKLRQCTGAKGESADCTADSLLPERLNWRGRESAATRAPTAPRTQTADTFVLSSPARPLPLLLDFSFVVVVL
jgi:hypothetical protein